LQHQLNGVLLYACNAITVDKNNASFNSGWGVYLTSTNDSIVSNNQLDFCDRVYRRPESGAVRVEADSAAIVMVKGSSRNQVLRNSCLCGGDGIFVVGYDYKGSLEPCMDNLFEDNDCRLSPNNGVEYSFCGGGIFRRNDCSRSNYGFWMGYIWDTVVEDNTVEFNRWVGIASERGHGVTLRNNRVRLNGEGIRLWTHGAIHADYPDFPVAYDYTVADNLIEQNRIGFNGYTESDVPDHLVHDLTLHRNTIKANNIGAQLERVDDIILDKNRFEGNVVAAIRLVDKPGVKHGDNVFADNPIDQQTASVRLP
jgi:parallel beta-helix repeat protein